MHDLAPHAVTPRGGGLTNRPFHQPHPTPTRPVPHAWHRTKPHGYTVGTQGGVTRAQVRCAVPPAPFGTPAPAPPPPPAPLLAFRMDGNLVPFPDRCRPEYVPPTTMMSCQKSTTKFFFMCVCVGGGGGEATTSHTCHAVGARAAGDMPTHHRHLARVPTPTQSPTYTHTDSTRPCPAPHTARRPRPLRAPCSPHAHA